MTLLGSILNHAHASDPTLQTSRPSAMNGTTGAGSTDSNSSITSNDFLTLLVTEMQNQDPTANNDPNQYINQLVQVNSLEQLISINQNLSTALGVSSTSASSDAPATPTAQAESVSSTMSRSMANIHSAAQASLATQTSQGNLSLPPASSAAQSLAHAFEQKTGVAPTAQQLSKIF